MRTVKFFRGNKKPKSGKFIECWPRPGQFSYPGTVLAMIIMVEFFSFSASGNELKPGQGFQDCNTCPLMVVIPFGQFNMGDLKGNGHPKELPVHQVILNNHFAVGKYEVTFEEWDSCVTSGGCSYRPDDKNLGRGRRPVDWVSWDDAKTYTAWLSAHTGMQYRLLSEAEWEYVSRAGTTTNFTWGDRLGSGNANCAYCDVKGLPQMIPVGSFAPNPFGVHDMVGSVNEWIEDCEHRNYQDAPQDGSAWITDSECKRRGVRGGSIYETEKFMLPSVRSFRTTSERINAMGFRVARSL
jgi:formylglycine-generating enzyme required for sulfatase activity